MPLQYLASTAVGLAPYTKDFRLKCLDRVLRTAARLVGRVPKFDRVSGYMQDGSHTHSTLSTTSLRWFGTA